jgi:glutamate-ammonia-ligase adenylyltransferase
MAVVTLGEEVERSADPATASVALERLLARQPRLGERLDEDDQLRSAVVAVTAASPHLSRLLITDPQAVEVLADLDHRPDLATYSFDAAGVARWKHLELLRIAARDLIELDTLEEVGVGLSDLAEDVVAAACAITDLNDGFAVIGMGKLGGRELNYASDIDIMLVGEGEPRPLLEVIRQAWRVDVNLRPEGRSGPLTRSLAS